MNHLPREPLDAEQRALAAALPRLHGRSEPDASLDARILAAARAAVDPPRVLRPSRRWMAPLAVAASLSLAVGLAWRLKPPPVAPDPAAAQSVAEQQDMAGVRALDAPPVQQMIEAPKPSRPLATAADTGVTAASPATTVQDAPAPPPPPAPQLAVTPAQTAAIESAVTTDMAAAPASIAPTVSAGMAKAARASSGARERAATSAPPQVQSQANEAVKAADAASEAPYPQPFADDPGQDVPPATADSPEVREAWLQRISELQQQGRSEEAKASLAEFRRRYPDATLPPALRELEPTR